MVHPLRRVQAIKAAAVAAAVVLIEGEVVEDTAVIEGGEVIMRGVEGVVMMKETEVVLTVVVKE